MQSDASTREQPEAAESEVVRLRRELADALEQQTATAEVLRIIASSPTDVQRVLDAVAERAYRLCRATSSSIYLVESDQLRVVAAAFAPTTVPNPVGTPGAVGYVSPIIMENMSGRTVLEGRVIHIADAHDPATRAEYPAAATFDATARSRLHVPLRRDGIAIGLLAVRRHTLAPFSASEIALMETFADQAVIAIQNAGLFDELERRNRDLSEALAQQTATSEIMRAIAASPTSLTQVLQTLVETVARLADADDASTSSIDRGEVTILASATIPVPVEGLQHAAQGSITRRAMEEGHTVHVHGALDELMTAYPDSVAVRFGFQSHAITPLLRDGVAIGTLGVFRYAPRPFSEEQIRLLETFADQAAIAIENARLFQELAELNRTLEARVGEQVDQLERVGRLRRYLSPQLAELIVSSGDESILASHRRRITVVFCDLRGFTAFAETEEPEEVMGVLGEYHAAMGELIRHYEGTFGHFAGDGLMIFFNDPLPQPDHVERAVRMACAMRERAADLARGWRRAGYELGFGVGVAVGYATLGRIGFEGRYDYDVIGTVANLAARLCAEAVDGQILIPARLHGMIEDLVEVETIGELTLKGLHRAVEAFNITGLRTGDSLPLDRAAEPPPGHA